MIINARKSLEKIGRFLDSYTYAPFYQHAGFQFIVGYHKNLLKKTIKKTYDIKTSLEFFPYSNSEKNQIFIQKLDKYFYLDHQFISVTHGAGGQGTCQHLEMIESIKTSYPIDVAAHLTAINFNQESLSATLERLKKLGINRLVVLRGDYGQEDFYDRQHIFYHATDLIKSINQNGDFDISVAAYPEKHPESRNLEQDLLYLKHKFDQGATRALSQFFVDCNHFFGLLDKAGRIGITRPIIPGVLLLSNFNKTFTFAQKCGVHIPDSIRSLAQYEQTLNNSHITVNCSVLLTTLIILNLIIEEVKQIHFYTLNDINTYQIYILLLSS